MKLRRAVFCDRDGTLIEDCQYLRDPDRVLWLPGTPEAIARLNRAGYVVVVVTNQSGVARGLMTERDVEAIHQKLTDDLAIYGARIDRFYYCPYHPDGKDPYRRVSRWRKPDIGMFEQAIADLQLAPNDSWMVGDKPDDVQFGRTAGLRVLRVQSGDRTPLVGALEVANFAAAVVHILAGDR